MKDYTKIRLDERVAEGERLLGAVKTAIHWDATVHGEERETHPSYREAMMDLVDAFDAATEGVIDRSNLVKTYDLD